MDLTNRGGKKIRFGASPDSITGTNTVYRNVTIWYNKSMVLSILIHFTGIMVMALLLNAYKKEQQNRQDLKELNEEIKASWVEHCIRQEMKDRIEEAQLTLIDEEQDPFTPYP